MTNINSPATQAEGSAPSKFRGLRTILDGNTEIPYTSANGKTLTGTAKAVGNCIVFSPYDGVSFRVTPENFEKRIPEHFKEKTSLLTRAKKGVQKGADAARKGAQKVKEGVGASIGAAGRLAGVREKVYAGLAAATIINALPVNISSAQANDATTPDPFLTGLTSHDGGIKNISLNDIVVPSATLEDFNKYLKSKGLQIGSDIQELQSAIKEFFAGNFIPENTANEITTSLDESYPSHSESIVKAIEEGIAAYEKNNPQLSQAATKVAKTTENASETPNKDALLEAVQGFDAEEHVQTLFKVLEDGTADVDRKLNAIELFFTAVGNTNDAAYNPMLSGAILEATDNTKVRNDFLSAMGAGINNHKELAAANLSRVTVPEDAGNIFIKNKTLSPVSVGIRVYETPISSDPNQNIDLLQEVIEVPENVSLLVVNKNVFLPLEDDTYALIQDENNKYVTDTIDVTADNVVQPAPSLTAEIPPSSASNENSAPEQAPSLIEVPQGLTQGTIENTTLTAADKGIRVYTNISDENPSGSVAKGTAFDVHSSREVVVSGEKVFVKVYGGYALLQDAGISFIADAITIQAATDGQGETGTQEGPEAKEGDPDLEQTSPFEKFQFVEGDTVKVHGLKKDPLNLRRIAGTSEEPIGTAKNGDQFTVVHPTIGKTDGHNWTLVANDKGEEFWLASTFIEKVDVETSAFAVGDEVYISNTKITHLYSPSESANIPFSRDISYTVEDIFTVSDGKEIATIKDPSDRTFWISTDFIQKANITFEDEQDSEENEPGAITKGDRVQLAETQPPYLAPDIGVEPVQVPADATYEVLDTFVNTDGSKWAKVKIVGGGERSGEEFIVDIRNIVEVTPEPTPAQPVQPEPETVGASPNDSETTQNIDNGAQNMQEISSSPVSPVEDISDTEEAAPISSQAPETPTQTAMNTALSSNILLDAVMEIQESLRVADESREEMRRIEAELKAHKGLGVKIDDNGKAYITDEKGKREWWHMFNRQHSKTHRYGELHRMINLSQVSIADNTETLERYGLTYTDELANNVIRAKTAYEGFVKHVSALADNKGRELTGQEIMNAWQQTIESYGGPSLPKGTLVQLVQGKALGNVLAFNLVNGLHLTLDAVDENTDLSRYHGGERDSLNSEKIRYNENNVIAVDKETGERINAFHHDGYYVVPGYSLDDITLSVEGTMFAATDKKVSGVTPEQVSENILTEAAFYKMQRAGNFDNVTYDEYLSTLGFELASDDPSDIVEIDREAQFFNEHLPEIFENIQVDVNPESMENIRNAIKEADIASLEELVNATSEQMAVAHETAEGFEASLFSDMNGTTQIQFQALKLLNSDGFNPNVTGVGSLPVSVRHTNTPIENGAGDGGRGEGANNAATGGASATAGQGGAGVNSNF